MALVTAPGRQVASSEDDIYTVLIIIATAFLFVATIILTIQFQSFYGLETLFQSTSALGN